MDLSDLDFLCEILEAVTEAGATSLLISDTVGYATLGNMENLLRLLGKGSNIEKAVISVHCHNDLGLAVANTLAAGSWGHQVEVAMNGIGERAGNASLEVVMAIHTRRNYLKMETNITTEEIYRTSRIVSTLTGMPIQHNKAVVGRNAFIHESGFIRMGCSRSGRLMRS